MCAFQGNVLDVPRQMFLQTAVHIAVITSLCLLNASNETLFNLTPWHSFLLENCWINQMLHIIYINMFNAFNIK